MCVYVIAQIDIHDRDGYSRYEEGFPAVFSQFQGELLAVSENPTVVEGRWPCTRTVLLKFPSREEAERWYRSPGYQALSQNRWRASTTNAVIVEGLSPS
jgi:uncharacterized protein (DUF1330 family)